MSSAQATVARARLVGVATAAFGAVLLARPHEVARAAAGSVPPGPGLVRVLGARYLAQGIAQTSLPSAVVMEVSAGIDGLHAASMVAVALLRAEYRRPALLSAAAATGSAAVSWVQARRL